jgi:hypothetical protein
MFIDYYDTALIRALALLEFSEQLAAQPAALQDEAAACIDSITALRDTFMPALESRGYRFTTPHAMDMMTN